MKKLKQVFVLAIYCCPAFIMAQYPGQYNEKYKLQLKASFKANAFNLEDVQLLESPFKQHMERNGQWLLGMDIDRLLYSWKINAGMSSSAEPLGGWEAPDCELRGHSMGHILSGLALMYASTGNAAYKNRGDSLVRALSACQQAIDQDGYLSAFPQSFIDRCIAGTGVWAPWYSLHKIMAGLTDMYLYAGNQQALDIVKKMSEWAYLKLSRLTAAQLAVMNKTEWGGMNEVLYNLYGITGDKNDLITAGKFYEHPFMDSVAAKQDRLKNFHANTHIPQVTGEARKYELTNDPEGKDIATFFWQTVIDHHSYATGGNSDREFFFEPDQLSEHLSKRTTETCNTYNMLKLTRHLFSWTADVKYADYYERALYNHILASQDPETSMVCYFMPLKSGSYKVYSTPTNSFWCCVGTGFESQAKFAEAIYYHDDQGIFINLFIPSRLTWKEKGVRLLQETRYPEDSVIHLTFETASAASMPLRIRYPSWAVSGARVSVNGKRIAIGQKSGTYIVLNRKWKAGDKIEISYPMSLRLIPANDNPNVAAVAYGPVILAGAMGTSGMVKPAPYAKDQNDFDKDSIPADIITTLNTDNKAIDAWLKPIPGQNQLQFKTTGVSKTDIQMIPYYDLYDQRYVIYWKIN